MASKDVRKFIKQLEAAGLIVTEKASNTRTGWVVHTHGGTIVGAFGNNVEHGRTRANILAQIKRRAGITL